jgi:DNA invertase Pin-like site-specific DNA recombinase
LSWHLFLAISSKQFAVDVKFIMRVAVAEHEREMISTRTRDALAAAKARGIKLGGGPKLAQAQANGAKASEANADRFAANVRPVIEQIRKSGITSFRAVAAALNARGVPTARGETWTPVQIMAIERRALLEGEI